MVVRENVVGTIFNAKKFKIKAQYAKTGTGKPENKPKVEIPI